MSLQAAELYMRFWWLGLLLTVIFLVAVPVILLMIWHQLGLLNEQLRCQRVIDEARLEVAERRRPEPATAPRPSPIRAAAQRAAEVVEEKLVMPAVKPAAAPAPQPQGENYRMANVAIARRLDSTIPKPGFRDDQEEKFFLLINHESKGPFSRPEVLRRLREGQVKAGTLCRPTDSMEWTPVESLAAQKTDDGCSVCGGPAGEEDKDQSGKLVWCSVQEVYAGGQDVSSTLGEF